MIFCIFHIYFIKKKLESMANEYIKEYLMKI